MNAVIMFGLIVIICLVGIFAGRSVSSASQWANGGKNLTWATVGLLLVTFRLAVPPPSALPSTDTLSA